tara:strand:+ start:371 stop:739 length:369 start_codon:yes stop_codon:yes gene_type:complete
MKENINEIEINGEKYVKKSGTVQLEKPTGNYVVIRTKSAGVHAGHLISRDGSEVVLSESRRLWYWKGAATLSQVAGTGITKPDDCKFPAPISEITVLGVIEIIPCTVDAMNIIKGVLEWKEK